MTNISKNEYIEALNAKLESAELSDANARKMQNVRNMLANDALASLLRASDIEASRFTRAIYASEKCVKFAHHAVERYVDKINENALAAFKTAMLCASAERELSMRQLEASLSKDIALHDDETAITYRRNVVLDASTVRAQSQQVRDMLITLSVISATSRNTFAVKRNALAEALCEKLNIA